MSRNNFKYAILVIAILFSDALNYFGLSVVTKVLFCYTFVAIGFTSKKIDVYIVIGCLCTLYLFFFVGFIFDQQNLTYFIFPLLIAMGFLLAQTTFNPYDFRALVIYFLLVNGIVLVFEKLSGSYVLDSGHQYSLIQGQGMFTWTKVQGEFLIAMSLLFIKDRPVLLIILLSALLSGVRAAVLLPGFLLLLTLFNSYHVKYKLSNKYSFSLIFVATLLLVPVFQNVFNDYNIERYTSMLDLDSSTYSVRGYVHDIHYGCIAGYSPSQLLFGKGEYCAKLFNWGAESTFIHVIEYYGLILSFGLFSIFIYVLLKNLLWSNYERIAVLVVLMLYMWNWRFGFTYMGIFIWWYIFQLAKKGK
jgi:hypothetical protein